MLGLRHWIVTVSEDEDSEAGCHGTALAAAGEGGEEGRLPWPWAWPWPWELVRWKRHLKDPAWVAGAQTHLEAGPWPAPDGADADPGHLLRVFLELWLADLHEINSLSCGGKYNTHNPYCYALASAALKFKIEPIS
ncbi:hypothetical protein VPH35_115151 [Triticum aestivum]